MISRVNRYYQLPASPVLVNHLRNEIGLTEPYQRIFDDLRKTQGDTQLHADNCLLPIKTYNTMSATVGRVCVTELIRLAEIGLETERKRT